MHLQIEEEELNSSDHSQTENLSRTETHLHDTSQHYTNIAAFQITHDQGNPPQLIYLASCHS